MARYRQALLGISWTVLQPILLMLVFTIFFGVFAQGNSQGVPHPVFYFLGLLPFYVVSRILNEGSTSIVANAELVTRVYFPRAYLPAATGIGALVDFGFGLLALAMLLVIFRLVPNGGALLVPVSVAVALAAGLGVALWLSALNAVYRDIAQLLPSLTQLWFFGSPILYPSDIVPMPVRLVYYLNPLAVVIDAFRSGFAGTPLPPWEAWILGGGMAGALLLSGYLFFRHKERTFADVV